MKRLAALGLLVATVAVAGCTSDDPAPPVASPTTTTSAAAGPDRVPAPSGPTFGDGDSTGAGRSDGGGPANVPAAPTPPTPPSTSEDGSSASAPATNVELQRACVVRGSATRLQGFTADVPNGAIVIYSTEYSDQSNELSNPEYTTGFGDARAVGDGGASATWVVPAQAPTGSATLHVAGTVELHPRQLPFTVVAGEEDCP